MRSGRGGRVERFGCATGLGGLVARPSLVRLGETRTRSVGSDSYARQRIEAQTPGRTPPAAGRRSDVDRVEPGSLKVSSDRSARPPWRAADVGPDTRCIRRPPTAQDGGPVARPVAVASARPRLHSGGGPVARIRQRVHQPRPRLRRWLDGGPVTRVGWPLRRWQSADRLRASGSGCTGPPPVAQLAADRLCASGGGCLGRHGFAVRQPGTCPSWAGVGLAWARGWGACWWVVGQGVQPIATGVRAGGRGVSAGRRSSTARSS